MTITRFQYKDRARGWTLENTQFGQFNLLVGLSGAGKTSIVNALRDVRATGLSARSRAANSEWCIELSSEGINYTWSARTSQAGDAPAQGDPEASPSLGGDAMRFESESIIRDGRELIDRRDGLFKFEGEKLPKLKDTESAISLLEAEESMAPLHRALQRIVFSNTSEDRGTILTHRSSLDRVEQDPGLTLDGLRDRIEMPILIKAYISRKRHQQSFDRIREQYREIFPTVTDVTVGRMLDLDPREASQIDDQLLVPLLREAITVAIKEECADGWIVAPYISSGMLRTFFHLAELELAPSGTVLVIDEYENSMGENCLPAVTEHFLRRQSDLQFILTSHHPYVINNIRKEWWRLVTRRGGTVQVRSTSEIPSLNTNSRQDNFTLLINSPIYEEGIQ